MRMILLWSSSTESEVAIAYGSDAGKGEEEEDEATSSFLDDRQVLPGEACGYPVQKQK